MGFEKIAPYLQSPLVLVGFVLLLFFGLLRLIIKQGIIPQLNRRQGFDILQRILWFGFIIAIAVLVSGVVLKSREMSRSEQVRVVKILETELSANAAILDQVIQNTTQMVDVFDSMANTLRNEGVEVISTLFPESNIRNDNGDPTPSQLAVEALISLEASGLLNDELQMERATEAGRVIAATVGRTRNTLQSLEDAERVRFVFERSALDSHIQLLQRVSVVDLTTLQETYTDLDRIRNNYGVIANSTIEYVIAVEDFFSVNDRALRVDDLAKVLAAERQAIILLLEFVDQLGQLSKSIKNQRENLTA